MEKFRKYIKPILFVLGTSFSILLFKIWLQKKNKINNQNLVLVPLRKGEAKFRSNIIKNLKYTLFLQLNTNQDPVIINNKPHKNVFQGSVILEFDMVGIEDIFLDFEGNVLSLEINSEKIKYFVHTNGRIYLPAKMLSKQNRIHITYANHYSHKSQGLRYYIDSSDESTYIYSQYEPFFAHTTFPCFDQPSLKASIRLIVSAPDNWTVISCMDKKEEVKAVSDKWSNKIEQINREIINLPKITRDFTIHEFNTTPNIPTYSFAVCAGPFEKALDLDTDSPAINIYCRKSMINSFDPHNLRRIGRLSLEWFKANLKSKIPCKKFDFVFVPELKNIAMENVGCITFDDRFIESNRTSVDNVYFNYLIIHELVHTWFGNYVTPEWWDDLWLKESFATFLSYLCLQQIAEVDDNFMTKYKVMWLLFSKFKTGAIKIDQFKNTHRIKDIFEDTSSVITIYDKITYYKGASVLKYLYYNIGHELFFKNIENFLNSNANSVTNYEAFKESFKSISDKTNKDINSPLEIVEPFIKNKGVVRLDTEITYKNNLIEEFKVRQVPCIHATEGFYYKFIFDILIIYPGKEELVYNVKIDDKEISVISELKNREKPLAIIIDPLDNAYLKHSYDGESKNYLIHNSYRIKNPITRLVVSRNLSEMITDCSLSPEQYVHFTINLLLDEREDLVVDQVIKNAINVVTKYVYYDKQANLKEQLFDLIKNEIFFKHKNIKKTLLNYMIDLFDAGNASEINNLINFLKVKPDNRSNLLRGNSLILDTSYDISGFDISYLDEATKFRLLETIASSEVLSNSEKNKFEEMIKSIKICASYSSTNEVNNPYLELEENKPISILTGHSFEKMKIEACRPDIKYKEKLWQRFINRELNQPNEFYEYEMRGFARKSQYELLKNYFTTLFFQNFVDVKEKFGEDYAVIFFENLSPSFVVDDDILKKFLDLEIYVNYNEYKLQKTLIKSTNINK